MNNARLVELTLSRPRIEKLVICLGHGGRGDLSCASAAGTRVARLLLAHCRPAASDVHDASRPHVHARDKAGRPRPFYALQTRVSIAQTRRGQGGTRLPGGRSVRSPQTWDSEPPVDFMGLWCGRLLLGDSQNPARCALYEPQVPAAFLAEAIRRVAQAHRRLARQDVLLVMASADLPLGLVRLVPGLATTGAMAAAQHRDEQTTDGTATTVAARADVMPCSSRALVEALAAFAPSTAPFSTLLLGTAASTSCAVTVARARRGDDACLTPAEEARMQTLLVPLATFAAALWTVNPGRCAQYLQCVTPTPAELTAATANQRLWRTMQASMLSTRDAAVLEAYYRHQPLDPRLSEQQTHYLAETLLRRLDEAPNLHPHM